MDIKIKYRDNQFKCNGTFTANDCKTAPFTDEFREVLDSFEKDLGPIKSIEITL